MADLIDPVPVRKTQRRRPRGYQVASADILEQRPPDGNPIAELKTGSKPRRSSGRDGMTRTVSFTITPQIDQALHEIAVEENVSRSHVFRQALIRYYAEWKASQ